MARFESPSVSVTPRGSARAGGDAECTVVWLQGDHDAATNSFLAATLTRAAELDAANILVDLAAVTFMDASTIGVVIGARNRLYQVGRSLEVRAPSPAALQVLQLCDLTHLIRPTPPAPAHSIGTAAALGTWVAVPAGTSNPDDERTPAATSLVIEALSDFEGGGS